MSKIIGLGCFLLIPIIAYAQDCDLKRDRDGIKVFTCKTENEKFKSLRAEFELTGSKPQQVKDFLWDVANYKTWQYNLMEATQVAASAQNELTYRALIDAPWPAENREIVVKMVVTELDSGMTIRIVDVPYIPQPPNNFVRVPFFEANWQITQVGHDLKLVYALRIDPGGYVPAWLVNIAMAEGPHVSFKNLKAQLNPK
jgi:hypothetical protein